MVECRLEYEHVEGGIALLMMEAGSDYDERVCNFVSLPGILLQSSIYFVVKVQSDMLSIISLFSPFLSVFS